MYVIKYCRKDHCYQFISILTRAQKRKAWKHTTEIIDFEKTVKIGKN